MKLTPEQKAAILKQRHAEDPCKQYQPAPTFIAYHQSTALYRAIAAVNQVGKTTALLFEAVWRARRCHPYRPELNGYPHRILCVIPSRSQAAIVWGKRFLKGCELKGDIGKFPMIPKREILKVHNAYSPSGPFPGMIELRNGSVIYFALSGDVNGWKRIEGLTLTDVFRDEADGTENMSEELQPRLLKAQSANADGSMPGAGGIDWAATATKPSDEWRTFRERCADGLVTPIGRYELFKPNPNENPAVDPNARAAMALTMSAEAFAIRGDGDSDAEDSLHIWRHWSRERNVRKTPYEVMLKDNLWISYDPGWKHPCGIGCFVVNRQNPFKLILNRYDNYKFGSLREHVRSMVEWLDGRFLTGLVCDPSVNRNLPQGVKHLTLLENELHEQNVKIIQPILLGRNRLEDMVPQVERYLEQGLLEVDPEAPGADQYIREMEMYRWSETGVRKVHLKAKGGDEAPDLTKYIVSRAPGWVDHGDNPRRGVHAASPAVRGDESAVDPFAGLSEEQKVHMIRMNESALLYDEMPAGESFDVAPVGLSRW